MKKCIIVLLFMIIAAGCSSQEQLNVPPQEQELPNIVPTPETIVTEQAEPTVVPKQAVADSFDIFNPQLTYDGAYNGPLYGTSEQVGSADMDDYFKLLDRNGINFFIGMFGIEGEPTAETLTSDDGLGKVIDAVQKHPHRVVPFFNPGIGGEDVEQYLGDTLTGMYRKTLRASKAIAGDDFIRGFGEVETQEWQARHDDPRVIQLVELARTNNIHVMYHPVASKIDDVEELAEKYPDITFLIHMYREDLDKSKSRLIKIVQERDNIYFSMDAAHIIHVNNMDIIYDYDSANAQSSISKLVSTYDSKEKSLVASAIDAYKPLVDAAPDKIMWGTEIGPAYAFDEEVFDRAVKASRLVIAGFDKADQEAVGYKNALRVFGQGVTVDAAIEVMDTAAWADCTDDQMGSCDESCEIPDGDFLTAEQDACFSRCLIEEQCTEVIEMDIG